MKQKTQSDKPKIPKASKLYFYKDAPIFGLDIGSSSLKVMQIGSHNQKWAVFGYGRADFDPTVVKDGVITDTDVIAKTIRNLLDSKLVGHIHGRRMNIAIPATRTFARSMSIPLTAAEDLADAVRLEVEQYVPMPLNELYLDYNVIGRNDKEVEMLAVAVPKRIVDSYVALAEKLDLEILAVEPTSTATCRLFVQLDRANVPTLLIDFGAFSTDISVYDKALITTNTIAGGGDNFTALLVEKLHVSQQEAYFLKTNYGLDFGHWQKQISGALEPLLERIVEEIRRILRYYEEHSTAKNISQIVTTGGGANIPGINEYLTNALRVPSRPFEPWPHVDFQGLPLPGVAEKSMYAAVAGLALLQPKEVFE